MSQENVEMVRRADEARNRGDIDAAFRDFHLDVEFDLSESRAAAGGVVEGVIRGRDTLRERLRELLDLWEKVTWQVEEVREVGPDQVISVAHFRVRGRDGLEFDDRGATLWTFSGGQVVRVKFFPSKEQALEAVGLRE
jgi:ketosteroid isomerase-like protein